MEKNMSTRNHETAALKAATFNLIMTISPLERGRTATKEGTERSVHQKSGFENPLPKGNARRMGVLKVTVRIRNVLSASFRNNHESGAMTRNSSPAMQSGNKKP